MAVLLLETDPETGNRLFDSVRDQSLPLYWVTTPQEALDALFEEDFEVVVVDLDRLDNTSVRMELVCELRRQSPKSRLVAITNREQDLAALDGCVEAVVSDPLDAYGLLRAIHGLLVRESGSLGQFGALLGSLYINFAYRVVEVAGEEVCLTAREFDILRLLAQRPGAVVGRRRIIEQVFKQDSGPESNSLEVHIHNLRGKIGKARIATVRGVGYRLRDID